MDGQGGERSVRRSRVEGRALVARYRASGESASAFCRRTGVAAHVLRYWLARAPKAEPAESEFFVVSKPATSAEPKAPPAVEDGERALIIVLPATNAKRLASTVAELLSGADR